jgi:hypothetical protein
MSDDDDPSRIRWEKMSPVIAAFAGGGILLGVLIAALIVGGTEWGRSGARLVFSVFGCGGFVVGLVVGVTVDTLVFQPLREKKRKRRRRRERDDPPPPAWPS